MTSRSTNKPAETEELESFIKGEGVTPELEGSLLQIFHIFKSLENTISWTKLSVENHSEAVDRLREGRDPRPIFSKPDVEEANVLELLDFVEEVRGSLDPSRLKELGITALDPSDVNFILENTSQSYRSYMSLIRNLSAENFRDPSHQIWSTPDQRLAKRNIEYFNKEGYDHRPDGSVEPQQLKQKMIEEVESLGFDWNVEIRDVGGCFNDVSSQTLVVASGSEEKRFYTEQEADLLAVHEVFHAARAFNGKQIVQSTDFPEFTALNTGFYDQVEEGGAVKREFVNLDVPKWKEDDYRIKQVCCSLLRNEDPVSVKEELIDFGVPEARACDLVLMNMTRLRHHVYLEGTAAWNLSNPSLMTGKVNPSVARIVWKEVVSGSFENPQVSLNSIFSS